MLGKHGRDEEDKELSRALEEVRNKRALANMTKTSSLNYLSMSLNIPRESIDGETYFFLKARV